MYFIEPVVYYLLGGDVLVEDSLEAYMSSVKAGAVLDKKAITSMKIQVSQLKQEKTRLEKMMNLAKPANMPGLKKYVLFFSLARIVLLSRLAD